MQNHVPARTPKAVVQGKPTTCLSCSGQTSPGLKLTKVMVRVLSACRSMCRVRQTHATVHGVASVEGQRQCQDWQPATMINTGMVCVLKLEGAEATSDVPLSQVDIAGRRCG